MDSLYFWPLMTLAAIFVGMGKGGLPVVAGLAVPSLSLIMSPVAAGAKNKFNWNDNWRFGWRTYSPSCFRMGSHTHDRPHGFNVFIKADF